MKAVILARVSTQEQEEGYSLDAQGDRLKDYCSKKGLDIVKEFVVVESSTRGERTDFYKMIDYIKAQKETIALVCDKVDRLQRSFKEVPVLEELRMKNKLILHFIQEYQVLDKNANASQLMVYQLLIMMANNYVNQISDNVKRSNERKLKQGEVLGPAPLGYLNFTKDDGSKTVIIDTERAYLIKKMFEEYATGLYSLPKIKEKVSDWGLVSKTGGKVSNQWVSDALSNPFYKGLMRYHNKLYPHYYDVFIDKMTWKKCQDVKKGRSKSFSKAEKRIFIFTGLVRCEKCKRLYSPEAKTKTIKTTGKTKEYIYLRPNHKGQCDCKPISEVQALKTIEQSLKKLYIPQDKLDKVKSSLKNLIESKKEFSNNSVSALRKRHSKIKNDIDKLLQLLLDDSITKDIYNNKYNELTAEKYNIEQKMNRFNEADDNFAITFEYILGLASRSNELFLSSGIDRKRKILNFVFSNLQASNGKVSCAYNPVFNDMSKLISCKEWLPKINEIRTEHYDEVMSFYTCMEEVREISCNI